MKTKVEINGYEIAIEDIGGNITVKAEKDGETVEEFTLNIEGGEDESESDTTDSYTDDSTSREQIKGFGEFGKEESDFKSEEDEESGEEEYEEEYEEEGEGEESEGEESEGEYEEGTEESEGEESKGEESGEEEYEEESEEEESEEEEKEVVSESLKTFQSFINSKKVK